MYRWQELSLRRLSGLDLKTNTVDVRDGFSLDLKNVIQNSIGVVSKRKGNSAMFASDESAAAKKINDLGRIRISGQDYYFKFSDGKFSYSKTLTGAFTGADGAVLSPSPAISTTNKIWWAALADRLYFVDGENVLRFFDGTEIKEPTIYARPTVAPTSSSAAGDFTYIYTVDKQGFGESKSSPELSLKASAALIRIQGQFITSPNTELAAGDKVRIYSRHKDVAAGSKLVAEYTWQAADVGTFKDISTVAITDDQPQLYTELGQAANATAPSALVGLVEHYGRLIAWKGDTVFSAKYSNANSFPENSATAGEVFRLTFAAGDGEGVQNCISFRESLYVLKKTKIAVFGGFGPTDTGDNPFTFRRLETNGIGCVAPKSVAVIGEEDQNYIIFLARTGWYATNGDKPLRVGENVETDLATFAESTLSTACGSFHKREGFYMCVVGSTGNRKVYTYDTRKDKDVRVGWFRWEGLEIESLWFDEFENRYFFGSNGYAAIERNAGTSADYSDAQVEFVSAGSVDAATDIITVTNSYATGDSLIVRTSGTAPGGVTLNTTLFAIRVSATQIKLATSAANALLGTAIDITSAGTGTHTIVALKAISAYYTTNWLNFGTPSRRKKLGKTSVIFNATASSISMTMEAAYDWLNTFQDAQTIAIRPSHAWGDGSWGGGVFDIWGGATIASPRNVATSRRKVRSVRFKFSNNNLNQDFDLQGFEQPFSVIRNAGNFASAS